MSTTFYPATDGQKERTIKTLEDMLRASVPEFGGSWEKRLYLIEVSYNKSYNSSIRMAPFVTLYGRKCRSHVCWDDVTDSVVLKPQMIQEMVEQVHIICQKMRVAQDRKKDYADLKRNDIEFALRKYVSDPSHVLEPKTVEMDESLTYVEVENDISDRKVRKTRNGDTMLVKVLWSNHNVDEAIWEAEDKMKEKYLYLFD
ncbi:uncharacterized protein LOC141628515 [Silene latifolia]|uniref:uncharacterized protein LOC141628515 n=1 Tax=Silene latifolia TaxID=37657 RepID=UPI003D777261